MEGRVAVIEEGFAAVVYGGINKLVLGVYEYRHQAVARLASFFEGLETVKAA